MGMTLSVISDLKALRVPLKRLRCFVSKSIAMSTLDPSVRALSIYICTKRAVALTKASLSHGEYQTALYSSQGIVGKGC